MKNIYLILIIIAIILVFGIFLIKSSNTTDNLGNNTNSNKIQEITLSLKDWNYYPSTIKVKANETVRIYLDESVVGCYRSFTIRDLGIAKYLATPEDYVEFTPIKPGTYAFACSMNMGRGTIIIE